jgi:hypothetical protein
MQKHRFFFYFNAAKLLHFLLLSQNNFAIIVEQINDFVGL